MILERELMKDEVFTPNRQFWLTSTVPEGALRARDIPANGHRA
ncbi:MAG: hypothetical protein ABI206_17865 [Antricoccus sp.]